MSIPVPLSSNSVSPYHLDFWASMLTVYKVHILLPSFFALSTYLCTHRQKQICLCRKTPSQNVCWTCGDFSRGRESQSTSKEQKKQKEAEEARKDLHFKWKFICLNCLIHQNMAYALPKTHGMRKWMLPHQSFPTDSWFHASAKEKERDKTGGLGGHWVKASNFSGAPDGPTRSGHPICCCKWF